MRDDQQTNNQTNFGFKKVSFSDKKKLVDDVFSSVAMKYDLMNDLMSVGIHRLWKKKLCEKITNLNSNILDVACGTGDISFRIKEAASKHNKTCNIVACDINEQMLKIAQDRAIDKNILQNIDFVCADAEKLPFESESFDYYIIAFGIRNVPHIEEALKEAYRVLKTGGQFLCLEFSKIENSYIEKLYNFYSFNIIPKIGQFIAKNHNAYQYLVESIDLFPDQNQFCDMIRSVGLRRVNYNNLSSGIAAIHSAYKL